ncbi:hypothetical protein GTW52_32345 [Streptomyces sp. SID8358]|uniref:hypothetical protein n=1 Tax=Streptomyces sp. SID8358 TaxID=2690342 RepID=UPI0011B94937|nr:hypothetical protein [Streptomyces sp. SID8358]MYU37742.1 hypothetical protein [Streptomyces sp. SID8358]
MDAGLAGLLGGIIGAAVGAIGAVGSAAVAGRKAEKQAHIQSQTQLRQLRMQIKADIILQQHSPRQEAYASFLAQARKVGESKANIYLALHSAYIDRHSHPTEEIVERIHGPLDELTSKLNSLTEIRSTVNVLGPDSIDSETSRLYRVACEIVKEILEYSHKVNIAIMENSTFPDPEDTFTRDANLDRALLEASSGFLDAVRPILDIGATRI